jgi:TP901 family phage tail tape measure protein
MSEVLRELVVALSLDSDNFSRNLRTINQQIKEAESTFKLAGAGVANFEKSIQGTEARLALLSSKQKEQTRAVDQYSRALVQTNQKLTDSFSRQEKMKQSLEQARVEYERLKGEVNAAGQQYNRLRASLGDADSATIAAKQNLESFKAESLAARDKVKLLEGQIKSNTKTLQNNTDAVSKAATNLNNAKAELKATEAELKKLTQELYRQQSAWTKAGDHLIAFAKKSEKISKSLVSAGRGFSRALTTPIMALGATAIKSSIDFESAFTSVRKTVDATEEEFASISGAIKQMSTQVAASGTDIAEVVAVAGQMGISNEHLMTFAKTMIDLGNSTDIVANDAALTLAKFANIADMNQAEFQNLGSTLVDLGNNYAATESQILEMSMRLAGAGHQVGLSEAQILGFATALSAVGIEAQMGGSAFSKALVKMEVASETGGQALKDFAQVSGMTAQQFKTLWDSNPAEAFQAFIGGLAKMDEEGASAIATLADIGIAEVRLRDTLMRATNATGLFRDTQVTANKAWAENSALAVEANKRYATTQSRLINLKNTALLFAQKVGDDLNPALQGIIDRANEMLAAFMGMDESQRMSIIKFAGFAAAIGPALLILGKTVGTVGKLSAGLGKFATGMGKFSASVKMAGGGLGGFVKTIGSSKLAMAALSAAIIYGAVKLAEYASGAKKAREALQGMQATADSWKTNGADTFYGRGGLSFFGMSEEDFTRDKQNATEWMNGLLDVWAGSRYKKQAVVKEWTESFLSLTEQTRSALKEKQVDAKDAGYTSLSEQMELDIKTLDSLDKEISRLLKRRQSGKFSDKDKLRLQELVDAREAIEIKYKLTAADAEGFETIQQKIDAEIARAQARGKTDADVTVYEAAVVASAEGMAAVNAQLDAQYDKEYQLIQLMQDGAEREAALAALNTRYIENRKLAAQDYAELLAGLILPVWNQPEIQEAGTDIDALTEKLRAYNLAQSNNDQQGMATALDDMNKLTAGMDEGALTEYLGVLTQVQSLLDSGMSKEEVSALFPEIDFTTQMEQMAALTQFVTDHQGTLTGLSEMLSLSLPEEVLKIATDLDMTGAQARWDTFASDPGSITTDAVIDSYSESENAIMLQPKVTAFVDKYTEVAEGASKASLTPQGLMAYVSSYAETVLGADVSGLTPTNITAMVAAYKELAAGADVTALTPDEITAYIAKYLEKEKVDTTGLSPNGLTAFVLAYEEATGGASTAALTPSGIAATVTGYLQAEGIDITNLTSPQIDAIVNAYAEATNVDKTALKAEVVALITAYQDKEGVIRPAYIQSQIAITGYDLTAYNAFVAANPVTVKGIVRLAERYENPEDVLNDPNATFWENGKEIPVNLVPASKISADTLMAYEEDGTLHVLITPKVTGTPEAVAEAAQEVTAPGDFTSGKWGYSTMGFVNMLNTQLKNYLSMKGGILDFDWFGLGAKGAVNQELGDKMSGENLAGLQTYVAEVVAAIKAGEGVSEEDMANLQAILTFVSNLETAEVGENIVAGISGAMAQAGWTSDAETTAGNLEAAINTALGIHSPSTRMVPVGQNVAAGVGQGLTAYDLTGEVSTLVNRLLTTAQSLFSPGLLYPQGVLAMAGLSAGIRAGQSGVVRAMVQAARAAILAAKRELDIRSPSRVFRDEVGRMTMKGWGQGLLLESRAQAKVVANAARYLTDAAKTSSVAYASSDNRRTYNQSSNVTLTGNTFQVRDDKDIQALAIEIAALTRRQHQGHGRRRV